MNTIICWLPVVGPSFEISCNLIHASKAYYVGLTLSNTNICDLHTLQCSVKLTEIHVFQWFVYFLWFLIVQLITNLSAELICWYIILNKVWPGILLHYNYRNPILPSLPCQWLMDKKVNVSLYGNVYHSYSPKAQLLQIVRRALMCSFGSATLSWQYQHNILFTRYP